MLALFLEAHRRPPVQIILDLDATDDPLHGHQEGRLLKAAKVGSPFITFRSVIVMTVTPWVPAQPFPTVRQIISRLLQPNASRWVLRP